MMHDSRFEDAKVGAELAHAEFQSHVPEPTYRASPMATWRSPVPCCQTAGCRRCGTSPGAWGRRRATRARTQAIAQAGRHRRAGQERRRVRAAEIRGVPEQTAPEALDERLLLSQTPILASGRRRANPQDGSWHRTPSQRALLAAVPADALVAPAHAHEHVALGGARRVV